MFLNQIRPRDNPPKKLGCYQNIAIQTSKSDFGMNLFDFCLRRRVRTPVATSPGAGAERFLDDGLDGPGTPPAFRAASETSVNLLGRAPQIVCCGHGGADVVIGQHVTRTHNHENEPNYDTRTGRYCWTVSRNAKGKPAVSSYSKLQKERSVGRPVAPPAPGFMISVIF